VRSRRRVVLLLATCVALLAVAPGSASGQQAEDWTITSYDVLVEVTDDAELLVVEDIALDFGQLERRGIFRYVPVWEELPSPPPPEVADRIPDGRDPHQFRRVLEVDAIEVESPSGAPADVQVEGPEDNGGNVFIRIGDPDTFVSGPQTYTIRYRVRGAVEPLEDIDALAWDAVGTGWPVPIQQATVRVRRAGVTAARCLQGPQYATDPCAAEVTDDGARFASSAPLAPYEGMTIALELDPGAVDAPPILIDEKPSLRRALIGSSAAIPLAVVVAVAGAGLLALLGWRQGRDRLAVGGVTSHGQIDETRASERRRGLRAPRAVPVEYRPPEGMRPAQLGLIIDERVDAVDVTATIVDLAVRGHLRIEEVEQGGWFRKADWRLIRGEAEDDGLLGYERLLLDGLFDGRDDVQVSDLKGTFATDYERVETAVYADGQSRRWFADRPDHTRARWLGAGLALTGVGGALTFVLGAWARMAVVGLVVVVLGIALMAIHRLMPRRTGRGSAMLTRTMGFREFVEQAESDRMEFAEAEQLFVGYLPYAVVFGCVERWAQVFEDIGVDVGRAVGGFYVGPGPFHLMAFSAGMNDFSSSMGAAVTAAPPSSGSGGFSSGGFGGGGGFSGGGVGGGGGGSW
jgi:uncharacterized membrane protein YgcG